MNELTRRIKYELLRLGADIVGFGDLDELPAEVRGDLPVGISVAVVYPPEVIRGIAKLPTQEYREWYDKLNERLDMIVCHGAALLRDMGYKAIVQSREYVGSGESNDNTLLPHKTVATRAGIGWIGKCALLVTNEYGSALRLSSILTDAPLDTSSPINKSKCGDCTVCTDACPGHAVSGKTWEVGLYRDEFFDPVKCRVTARDRAKQGFGGSITICGKCIEVCPHTQRYLNQNKQKVDLRPFENSDTALMEQWLYADHVKPWYEQPLDWLKEIRERHGEFSFITHLIAEINSVPIGFCQFYDCWHSRDYEDWGVDITAQGEIFSIDYLIGEAAFLRRGYGKDIILLILDKLRLSGAKTVIVLPDKQNIASNRALESAGFSWDGERYRMNLTSIIETERLILRPLTAADAETAYHGWTGDPDVAEYVSWLPHHSIEDAMEWLSEIAWKYDPEGNILPNDNYIWGFTLKKTGELFGSGGLIWEEGWQLFQVGYNIMKSHWNCGYTTEAMEAILRFAADNLGIKKVARGHAKENHASAKVLEKLGFVYDRDDITPHVDGTRFFDSREYYLELR